ncbi:hypothetical protein ACFVS2_21210 [Brevibacillus sp. NPDC058079]|uniref:hypothetical protein n=1 Tax=Brevibacillus sp. NPDC058079 TaxID=3346330 RepID=UPI0036E33CA0
MMRNAIFYVIGLFILGATVAFGVSLALEVLPYLVVTFICVSPVYGAIRRYKQWNSESLGMKSWMKYFMKIFKFGKPSLTFYLILGIAVYFVHGEIAMTLLKTIGFAVGGAIIVFIGWESVRVVLLKMKSIQIPTFVDAIKGAW